MTARKKHSVVPNKRMAYIWVKHLAEDITGLSTKQLAIDCGIVDVVNPRSINERLHRKKYMGLWSCGSHMTTKTMRPFPTIAAK